MVILSPNTLSSPQMTLALSMPFHLALAFLFIPMKLARLLICHLGGVFTVNMCRAREQDKQMVLEMR